MLDHDSFLWKNAVHLNTKDSLLSLFSSDVQFFSLSCPLALEYPHDSFNHVLSGVVAKALWSSIAHSALHLRAVALEVADSALTIADTC